MEKQIIDLIAKKQSEETKNAGLKNVNIELEVRFRDITKDEFETVISAARKSASGDDPTFSPPELECSINSISSDVFENGAKSAQDIQYIRRMTFVDGKRVSDQRQQKHRLGRSVILPGYRKCSVGLSKEVITSGDSTYQSTASNPLMRFKNRLSFGFSLEGWKWRLDLTAVKTTYLNEIGQGGLTQLRDAFFKGITADNFLTAMPHDLIDSYEIEIESMGADLSIPSDANVKKSIHPSQIFSAVTAIYRLISPEFTNELKYQDEIYLIASNVMDPISAKMFRNPTHRLKQLSNQAIVLSKNAYYYNPSDPSNTIFPPIGYYVTIKADGERCLISSRDNIVTAVMSHTVESLEITNTTPRKLTIADCECIMIDNVKHYMIFDVLMLDSVSVVNKPFSERVGLIAQAVISIGALNVTAKHYEQITDDIQKAFSDVYLGKYPFLTDGIVMTTPGGSYFETINYKWKPIEKSSIDFCAMKCPQAMLGIKPFEVRAGKTLYILFVGIRHDMRERLGMGFLPHYKSMFKDSPGGDSGKYYPIQFSPSMCPMAYIYYHDSQDDIHGKIIELGISADATPPTEKMTSSPDNLQPWVFHRVREDRKLEKTYFGNDFRVAELTFMNYIDPFNFEDLYQRSDSYFTKQTHRADNKYRRFVISNIIRANLSGAKWVIDLAAGRGSELHRFGEIGVQNALFIDIDSAAISELIRRKLSYFETKKNRNRKIGGFDDIQTQTVMMYDCVHGIDHEALVEKRTKAMTVHTLVADLTMPTIDLIARTFQYGLNCGIVDGMICNFALHYMCNTVEHLRGVLLFCAKMLRVGGLFMFTVMNGEKVFNLLKPIATGEAWTVKDPVTNNVVFSIRKQYKSTTLANVGQTISVLLPHLSDKEMPEPLCNVDYVIKEAERLGFAMELSSSMSSYGNKYPGAELSENDKKITDIYHYVTLRKIKDLSIKKDITQKASVKPPKTAGPAKSSGKKSKKTILANADLIEEINNMDESDDE